MTRLKTAVIRAYTWQNAIKPFQHFLNVGVLLQSITAERYS